MRDAGHERNADLAATGCGSGVLRSDDEAAVQPAGNGRVAGRISSVRRQPRIEAEHLDSGFIVCGECSGDPSQYLIDVEEVCPCCGGDGFIDDPDYIDGDARSFNARAEWGTHHRIYSRRG